MAIARIFSFRTPKRRPRKKHSAHTPKSVIKSLGPWSLRSFGSEKTVNGVSRDHSVHSLAKKTIVEPAKRGASNGPYKPQQAFYRRSVASSSRSPRSIQHGQVNTLTTHGVVDHQLSRRSKSLQVNRLGLANFLGRSYKAQFSARQRSDACLSPTEPHQRGKGVITSPPFT